MPITITEGLAELNTIQKRVQKKQEFINGNLARMEGLKDPLATQGGSAEVIRRELQSIEDLLLRHLAIRLAIQQVNQATQLTVCGVTRTVASWLTWRKEAAPTQQSMVQKFIGTLDNIRRNAQRSGNTVVTAGAADVKPTDLMVNIDEAMLAEKAEKLEEILGTLDGKLSLINATTNINID